jgi:two-component system nitrogen regulation response regulator NtrX
MSTPGVGACLGLDGAARLLIVDDDPLVRQSLREWLEHDGYVAFEAGDGKTALELLDEEALDLLLLDLQLPRISGIEVLREIVSRRLDIPVVIVSGKGTIPAAVETMKLGALDFVEKPIDAQNTLRIIEAALNRVERGRRRARSLEEALDRYGMVGTVPEMQEVYRRIERAAHTSVRVLIEGASGTGKELVARAIHRLGNRAGAPFVAVNCAAIPETMIEDELFGHVAHAFTDAKARRSGRFQEAHEGTLFLDEVGDMSLMTQAKVLRALEAGEVWPVGSDRSVHVNVRVIAATHRDLRALTESGDFREDLYYRLNVIPIRIPPLVARIDDLGALTDHFLTLTAREHALPRPQLTAAALAMLGRHTWPGNVRELENVVERLLVMGDGERIAAQDVSVALRPEGEPVEDGISLTGLREARREFERAFITRTLQEHGWRIQEAAASLEIDRSHLWKKMRTLGIRAPER